MAQMGAGQPLSCEQTHATPEGSMQKDTVVKKTAWTQDSLGQWKDENGFVVKCAPRPSGLISDKSSKEVWYSGYSPYFVRIIETTGKLINGLQYCRSSLPLSRKE